MLAFDIEKVKTVLRRAHNGHRYVEDRQQYGREEHWQVGLVGDCEDFAMWCRDELKKVGIAADLILCLAEDGSGHLVCSVQGWILDNRHLRLQNKDELPYKWLRLGRPDGTWYNIETA